ncbi:MAG: Rrf2 family transcriptional regulator [Dehalococcoidia bacterium]|nr:MAG: Rrf2 family transcriptional regulator [Dehalococcoidia bacterium]
MKISTRGRYGTRMLLDLAQHDNGERVLLRDISLRQGISLYYLERLISPLVVSGIIRTTRGPKGGVSLAKRPEKIKLSEVIRVLEGSTAPVECVKNPMVCDRSRLCATRDIWDELREKTDSFLESITIKDLVERQNQKMKSDKSMYYI